ncbi:glycosyltransferase family 39 protein [Lentzea sp. NPDC006480]|uniref:ArnT family glycosyltransferase n=1 Tax=Lentzea sp. NPDC006480 TaxID=3157176 RepID=UPI0033A13939
MSVRLIVFVLLAQMAVAMVTAAVRQTPTIDEPVYIGAAVVQLQQHSLRCNPEHPPFGKLIMSTGLVFAGVRLDPSFAGDQTVLGRHVLYESGNSPGRLLLLARLPMIVLTLLFGLVVFLFARDLFGPAGGAVSLALYTLSPDVIAHGSLATLDVAVAGFLLTAVWLTWRSDVHPALVGLALGAAVATKMTALAAVPVVLLLVVLSGRRLKAAWIAGLVAMVVVWASYVVVDPQAPFPQLYLDGMGAQFGMENRVWGGFLFGTPYEGARWYYLPAALLVKSPLGALVLWVAGVVVLVRRKRVAAAYVLAPTAVLLALMMTSSRDLGVRYAVFVPMFLAVAAGAVVLIGKRWAYVAVVLVAVSSLLAFPYYLPYSNEAFGGPSKTHLRLHDSNVDWGQDLGRLADRLRERYPDERIWLVYKGAGVPSYYGITASDPRAVPSGEVRGLLVVSDTAIAKADQRLAWLIASSTPIDEVGHSITIYRR